MIVKFGLFENKEHIEKWHLGDIVNPFFSNNYEDLDLNGVRRKLRKIFKGNWCKFEADEWQDEDFLNLESYIIEGVVTDTDAYYFYEPSELFINFKVNGVNYNVDPAHPIFVYLKEERKTKTNPELDPYGEEDWDDDINENINENSVFNKNITILDLSNKRLTELPDLSNLTNLRYLYCYNNRLTELPDLSNLTNLERLSCSNNRLTELPDLSNLTNLRVLYCYNNQLTELPDLSNLTNLKILYCDNNRLTELPDLNNLTNLRVLDCHDNRLTELPDLSNLTNLRYLYCHNNRLTELPDLSNLTNLRVLSCDNNQLPYNNLEEYKKWVKENKYTPEERERIRLSKLNIDPYGEEDWLDENNKYVENQDLGIGDEVVCLKGLQDGHEMEGRIGIITGIENNGKGYLNNFYFEGKMYQIQFIDNKYPSSYYVFISIVKPSDPEKAEKNRKKREELRLKHMDIDPYGEENWLEEGYQYDNSGNYTKIKKDNKHIDIDPYGEEDWDEYGLDWSKIKIVNPKSIKDINKRVLIVPSSEYYTDSRSNPKNVFGTILRHEKEGYPFVVFWDNGGNNVYHSSDLTIVED